MAKAQSEIDGVLARDVAKKGESSKLRFFRLLGLIPGRYSSLWCSCDVLLLALFREARSSSFDPRYLQERSAVTNCLPTRRRGTSVRPVHDGCIDPS